MEYLAPEDKKTMKGAGIIYKQNKLITHTTLNHHQSALLTFLPWQIITIILLVLALTFGLVLNLLATITTVIAILSAVYFIDVLFNIYVILKSLYFPPEISFESSQLKKIDNHSLPIYSILCPLYRESKVLPDFNKFRMDLHS